MRLNGVDNLLAEARAEDGEANDTSREQYLADLVLRLASCVESAEGDVAEVAALCEFCGVQRSTGSCFHPFRLSGARVVVSQAAWDEMIRYKNKLSAIEELLAD